MDAAHGSMGILVVGAGFLGAQRAAAAAVARNTRLVGVVDIDLDRARCVAARHDAIGVSTLDEGLDLEGVNAVVVATPPSDHVAVVEEALSRGKHVLCEKPLAINVDDAWRLASHADEARLRLATGFNHRFHPPVRDALAIVSAWGLGRVESVRVQIGHHASSAFLDGWHGDPEIAGGGTLIDNGPHACDLIRRFVGEVKTALGTIRRNPAVPTASEHEAFGLFRSHGHAVAELHSSWNLRSGYLTIEVRGASGWLKVETAPWRLTGRLDDGRRLDRRYLAARVRERLFCRRFGCERSLVEELESFATTDAPSRPGASGWDGCRAVELVEAIYQSDRERAEVSLAPRESMSRKPARPLVGRVA